MDISNLRRKAEVGNAAAQTVLGTCYLEGIDVPMDYSEAFRLLSGAAEQGAPRASCNLARMYKDGLGMSQNMNDICVRPHLRPRPEKNRV